MKHLRFVISMLLISISATCGHIAAQDSIVVFSDTTENAYRDDYDSYEDYNNPASTGNIGFVNNYSILPDDFFPLDSISESGGIIDFILGLGAFALIIFILSFILIPILVIALLVYLVYRSCRIKRDDEFYSMSREQKIYIVKKQAVKMSCWGAGFIIGELILDWSNLFYISGIILLGMAATKWWESRNM